MIGFPCAVGMSILAKPILFLFYSGSYTAEHLTIAGKLLQTSAMTIGLFTMVSGIIPQITGWDGDSKIHRKVFEGLPGYFKLAFYKLL